MRKYIRSKLHVSNINRSIFLKRYAIYSILIYIWMVLFDENVFITDSVSGNFLFLISSFIFLFVFSFTISGVIWSFKKLSSSEAKSILYYAERTQLFIVITIPFVSVFSMIYGIE